MMNDVKVQGNNVQLFKGLFGGRKNKGEGVPPPPPPPPREKSAEEKQKDEERKELDGKLWGASFYGDAQKVKDLIERGANVNVRDVNDGSTALINAAYGNHKIVAELLIANGADVNAKDYTYGRTALMNAAMEGHKDMVVLLVGRGADVNAKCNLGGDAREYAASQGHDDIATFLIRVRSRR